MSNVFIPVLNMTLAGSFIALVVMVIRLLLKKAPKIFSYMLWAAVFFRLICPFTFEVPVSLNPLGIEIIPQNIEIAQNTAVQGGSYFADYIVNNGANPFQMILYISSWIWIFGIVVLLLYAVITCILWKHRVANAILVKDNIYETDRISTPFVMGFIHSRIYVPIRLSEHELESVLPHEKIHIKRCDYITKPLAFLITILHWFNPIIWLSYVLFTKDMEMSADEAVLRKSSEDIRIKYSNALYSLSAKYSGIINPLAFGEGSTKRRIKNVLNYRKPAFWVNIVALLAVVLVCVCIVPASLIAPKTDTDSQNESYRKIAAIIEGKPQKDLVGLNSPDDWGGNLHGREMSLEEAEALIAMGNQAKFRDFAKYRWVNVSSNTNNYIMLFSVGTSHRMIVRADENRNITSVTLEEIN